jgi:hypothetical protein
MAKKTVDEPIAEEFVTVESNGATITYAPDDPLASLLISGIVEVADGAITWRAGHLEHIANLFAGDPVTTERNYADDLAVARAYSAETWEQLTNG